jgi:hypothetical protein
LRVIDGTVYVLCRDGIKRLHDRNNDGFAEYIEHFYADKDVSTFYHAFHFGLERDKNGYLYYAKNGQYTSYRLPGAVIKVAPDGESHEVFATGFRTPNGTGMLMHDGKEYLTVSDNEGFWMPSSKINLVEKGGFYGYVQTRSRGPKAWQPDGGKIDPDEVEVPETFDQPLVWIPKSVDNSSGGQEWVDDKRFGPLANHLMHTSYGAARMMYILPQKVGDTWQGGVVPLPHRYDSGIQRARVNPTDGQLYTVGLKGWDYPSNSTYAAFQRLRYTGKPFRMIDSMAVTAKGVQMTFNFKVGKHATKPKHYQVEQWNYKWNEGYGSAEWHPNKKNQRGREKLAVTDVTVTGDGKTVQLELEKLHTVHQIKVQMAVPTANGERYEQNLYLTVNKVPESSAKAAK